jgi:hypothetical protein
MTSRTAHVGKTSVMLSAPDHARVVGCAAADNAKSVARLALRHLDAIFRMACATRCDHMMLPAHAIRS